MAPVHLARCGIFSNWRLIVIIIVPMILLPLLFLEDSSNISKIGPDGREIDRTAKFRCAYVIIMMAIFWILEVVPLAITSFLPVILLPLLQVQSTGQISKNYMKETNLMFLGGLIISFSMEYSNLHRRIALKVLTIIGSSPPRILLGLMLTTMFLSMWMLNSATAAMMCPVALAILRELNKDTKNSGLTASTATTLSAYDTKSSTDLELEIQKNGGDTDEEPEVEERKMKKRQKQMMLLAICFASDIGGSGVVTGTTPNMVTFQLLKELNLGQNGKYADLTFATWMAYAVPPMLINVIIAWICLTITFLGFPSWSSFRSRDLKVQMANKIRDEREHHVYKMLVNEYKKLGKVTFHQLGVTVLYFMVIMLWLFRDPRFVPGWGKYFPNVKIGDSTAAMLIAFLLFAVPKDPTFLRCGRPKMAGGLLDWKYVQKRLPWDVVILMGSGFAISDAADKSGLSAWIGDQLDHLSSLNDQVLLIIVMLITSTLTEVLSNGACANVVIPILISLSKRLRLHPLYLTLPSAVSCSFAFMLPVGAPTNGIVYAAADGDIRILDMVKSGIFIKIFCTIIHFLIHISYGNLLFDFTNYQYDNTNLSEL